jgi:hypothetical protein
MPAPTNSSIPRSSNPIQRNGVRHHQHEERSARSEINEIAHVPLLGDVATSNATYPSLPMWSAKT